MNCVKSNNQSLKIQKFTPLGYKDNGAVFDFFPLKMRQKKYNAKYFNFVAAAYF